MSRTKNFLYNSITTALYQAVVMLAGFITPRIMLQYYGSEINGLVSSINQFIVYFNLVEAGLSGAATYALYKPLANNDYNAINGVITAAKKFYTQAGFIFVSLTLGLAFFYPSSVLSNDISSTYTCLLVLILGFNGALEFFTLSKYRVLLSADQRTYVISLASLVHIVVNTGIIVALARLKINIVILRFVALFSVVLRSLILMVYVKIKYKFIDYNVKPNFNALNKRWDALYLQILGAVHTGTPVVILTLLTKSLKLVSIYAIFNMVLSGLNGILNIFKTGLAAAFGDLIAREEIKTLQKAYSEFEFLYYSLITIIYSIALVTIMPFIRIYTKGITDVNYNLPLIGFLFVLNGLLYNMKTPQGMLVISAGMYKETKLQTTVQGAIAVFVGACLTPILGLKGVLIGSILSNVYRDIDLLFFIPKNVTKLPVRQSAFRIIRIILCIMVVAVPFYIIKLDSSNYMEWIVDAIFVSGVAILVVLINGIIFERNMMLDVAKRIYGMVGR